VPLACLTIPAIALACEIAERPALATEAVAITGESRARVLECSPRALSLGVWQGMPLRKATALCPGLVVLEQRPALVARVAAHLVEAIASISPLVEEGEPGIVYADLRGMEALYPRPGLVEQAIFDAVPSGIEPRLGTANTKFTAEIAARCSLPGESLRIEPDEARDFLSGKPASWLPLDHEAIERLGLLGIRTIGDFAAFPRPAVEAQFGKAGGRAWLAARGEDPSPLRPRPFEREQVLERVQAQPPLVSRDAIARTTEQMLIRALRHPRALNRFVCSVRVCATTDDDRLWERVRVLREPAGGQVRLWAAIRPLLEDADYPGPVAELELELGGLTSESGRQPALLNAEQIRKREQLDEMVRHLKVRYGHPALARVVEVEPWSRIPERRHALMDYDP
jgi:nucleotidyltransferase/DNA polymerase involved in DNA repair